MTDRSLSRRDLLGAAATALVAGATSSAAQPPAHAHAHAAPAPEPATTPAPSPTAARQARRMRPGLPGRDYTPVITPNGSTLPFRIVDGVKVFHLIAEEVRHEFVPGLTASCWGYNGSTPGPTIEAVEGDHVRIYVTNRLPVPTSVHWHGVLLPSGMDGVSGLTQAPIAPGETFRYEFTLRQHGSCMYHSHYDEMVQQAMGMMGMFIIHQRAPAARVDKDFVLLASEWKVDPGTSRPDPLEMIEFNVLTFNSKAFPATAPLVIRTGDRVRVRIGNLSATDHHTMHLHGFAWRVVGTDGGEVPLSARAPESTVIVPVGTTRTMEFVADQAGDWALHCHMTHHTMTQMGHDFGNWVGVAPEVVNKAVQPLVPSYMTMGEGGMAGMAEHGMEAPRNSVPMLGAPGPFSYIDMGGMFTVLKVRDDATTQSDPGWYRHPAGEVARIATPEELRRDGIRT
jgi:manganese oxidase